MRKYMLLLIVLLIPFHLFSENYVYIIPREGNYNDIDLSIEREIVPMLITLREAGYTVKIASVSGKNFNGENVIIKTDSKVENIDTNTVVGIVMPCMSVGVPGPLANETIKLLKETSKKNVPIAAQDGSVCLLSAANLLKGVKYAFYTKYFDEGEYYGKGAVRSGNIITSSGDPGSVRHGFKDQTEDLMRLFLEALKDK